METTKLRISAITLFCAICLATLGLALGLSGCAEQKFPPPMDYDQGRTGGDVRYVISVYLEDVPPKGKTVGITRGVQNAESLVWVKQTRPMTRAELVKLIEQCLRDQAGVVVVHRDRKHIIFGLSGNPDKQPVQWFGSHLDE